MTRLSDDAVQRLQWMIDLPDLPPRYAVHEVIGRGGMGTVYRAHDEVLGRDVAVKVTSALRERTHDFDHLLREARILATLEHPGITPVHDAGELQDGRCWYAMRLVRGETLAAWATQHGMGDRLRTFLRVCDAIAFAHSHDVIHRDIKPGNVMIGNYGEVLVLDWGIAQRAEAALGESNELPTNVGPEHVAGTPGFMAPEQREARHHDIDVRTDVYALGAVLRTLFADETVPRPLQAIAGKATSESRSDRYATVLAMADDVRRWLDGERVGAYRYRWWEKLQRFYLQNQTIVLLFLAYVVVRIVILWWRGV